MVDQFKLTSAKPISTPMETGMQFSINQSPSTPNQLVKMKGVPYAEAIGSIIWPVVVSRPDGAYAVGCHGPCSVMFFPKNNQRTALTESLMMAASPLFSATIITGHPRWTYIGAPSEYFLHSTPLPPTKPAFLSLSLPTSTMCFLPQHDQSPTMLHTRSMFQANHIAHAPVLEVMSHGHHKDLRGFTSASLGTLWNTSLLIICSFYYHMLFTITPYMFMFCLCINTPVCCMYFASSNINLATYFSLTCSRPS